MGLPYAVRKDTIFGGGGGSSSLMLTNSDSEEGYDNVLKFGGSIFY